MRLIQFKTAKAQSTAQSANQLRLAPLIESYFRKDLKTEMGSQDVLNLIASDHVFVNESLCRTPAMSIKPGATISFLTSAVPGYRLAPEQIVFEDEHLIVTDKPSGWPTQATYNPREDHLYHAVIAHLSLRTPGRLAYAGLHHRLDRETSGLVLMTKRKAVNKAVTDLFRDRQMEKTYWAISTATKPPRQTAWTIDNHLKRKPQPHQPFFFASAQSGGDRAITQFRILDQENGKILIEARPKTGRTHQIRVHLSEYGLPIYGDKAYHPERFSQQQRLLLHAMELKFKHPSTGLEITAKAPAPAEFADFFPHLKL